MSRSFGVEIDTGFGKVSRAWMVMKVFTTHSLSFVSTLKFSPNAPYDLTQVLSVALNEDPSKLAQLPHLER